MMLVIAYLLGLPLGVWLLAGLCALVDEPRPVPALLRLIAAICVVLLGLLVTDRALLPPLLYAFATIVLLHAGAFWLLRHHGIGMPILQQTPPPPPLLHDEDAVEESGVKNPGDKRMGEGEASRRGS